MCPGAGKHTSGAVGLKDQSAPANHGALGAIALNYAQCQWPGNSGMGMWNGSATCPKTPGNGWYFALDPAPAQHACSWWLQQPSATGRVLRRQWKPCILDRKKLLEEVIYGVSFVSNHSFADQSGFVIRTVFKAWRGQPNRNCCSVEYKHCALEGLEKAYVEYAQLMSRIWKTLVAWTPPNMKTLPGFLIR